VVVLLVAVAVVVRVAVIAVRAVDVRRGLADDHGHGHKKHDH